MAKTELADGIIEKVTSILMELLSKIPDSDQEAADQPDGQSRSLTRMAASKAAAVSGTLSLPPGPAGMLTVLPDLYAVWRIQAQLVSDIAAANGKSAMLTRETMLFCLFRHAAAQALRDIAVRVGGRVLVKRASLRFVQNVLRKIGVRVTQRVLGRGLSRWLPVVGAIGVAAYAFYDTVQVGDTAREFFSQEIQLEAEDGSD